MKSPYCCYNEVTPKVWTQNFGGHFTLLVLRPEIPWKQVMGMRDHIAHGYFDIDAELVFQTVKYKLDPLLDAVRYFINYLQ